MGQFEILYNDFETTKDISGFTQRHSENNCGIRFLLLRSLDSKHLAEILTKKETIAENNKFKGLLKLAYNTNITIEEVINYIESKRDIINNERNIAEEGLEDIIKNFGTVNCGLRNDKVDDIVKALVRDKSIKTIETLRSRVNDDITPRIKNYILWSFYNQTTNDLIEHAFIKHKKIIPTLRKIHDIDFFVKIENDIIPFDLKITHIADDFFDMYSKGLSANNSTEHDSYSINQQKQSEIETIKEYYKSRKRDLSLPNYGGLSKSEMLNILHSTKIKDDENFVDKICTMRKGLVENIGTELKKLEWWNYKFQGERLFSNNNRLFIFLAYTNAFEDGRPLKGKIEIIENAVNNLLNNINKSNINTIKYHYDKEAALTGNYTALSTSLLITANK